MAIRDLSQRAGRPAWHSIAARFGNPQECLAAFIALETAEVLRKVKPANLVTVTNRTEPCGRNLYQLWKQYGSEIIGVSGLHALELVDRRDSLLLLFYDRVALAALLARRDVTAVLTRAGYMEPADSDAALAELQRRIIPGRFPHEIGVFLGYPLKDVIGFMGWARLPFTCQGPWKIYGNPSGSLELANSCRECRCRMASQLAKSINPKACFSDAAVTGSDSETHR